MTTPHERILARLQETCPLGVDVDPCRSTGLRLLMIAFNLRYLFPEREVRFYKTGRGFHFEVDAESNIEIRRSLRDCKGRLWFSELRDYDDVLFDRKRPPGSLRFTRRLEIPVENLVRNKPWSEVKG